MTLAVDWDVKPITNQNKFTLKCTAAFLPCESWVAGDLKSIGQVLCAIKSLISLVYYFGNSVRQLREV